MHWVWAAHGPWPLFGLFWFVLMVFFVSSLIRWFAFRNRWRAFAWHGAPPFAGRPYADPSATQTQPSALEILSQRYARGEIDDATFDAMRERLENANRHRQ